MIPNVPAYDEYLLSDLHKDCYGFRPKEDFWYRWEHATEQEREEIWNNLLAVLDQTIEHEEEMRRRAVDDFEAMVNGMRIDLDLTREQVIDRLMKEHDADDHEHLCFIFNLPYRYFK